MTWSGKTELKAQLVRLWDRGELLRDAALGHSRFPLRLTLKSPSSADITDQFDAVRAWVTELALIPWLRIEWQEIRHRIQGVQKIPASVWLESIDNAVVCLSKRRDWDQFLKLLMDTQQALPILLPWLAKRPLQALALASDWSRLLAVVDWLVKHPRPNIYLRQVDLPAVHTKFIESHLSVLSELLDLALPNSAIDTTKKGRGQFALRYGFLDKPVRVRFRVLDPLIKTLHGVQSTEAPDITLDAESFSRLDIPVQRVFIIENEISFLAFPKVNSSIVIFGSGYGWDALARSDWLRRCAIHYWGDIDTDGFCILDQLRQHFSHADSFLMDRATLKAHASVWGVDSKPKTHDLFRLTSQEKMLYDDLKNGRIQTNVRLEQEHIGFNWMSNCLDDVLKAQMLHV